MTNATRPIFEFFAKAVEARGGLAEFEETALAVVLPGDLARELGRPEAERLPLDLPGASRLFYGCDTVERLRRLLAGRGTFAETKLGAATRKTDFRPIVERTLDLVNAVGAYRTDSEATRPHLFLTFAYAATADEKREGLVEVAVDEETALEVPHRLADVLARAPGEPGTSAPAGARGPERTARACDRAREIARERALVAVEPFKQALIRRLAKDMRRVREYYERLADETRRAALSRRNVAEREARLAKIPHFESERDRQLADLTGRYALDVELKPVAAVRVQLPIRRILWEVRRRDHSTELELAYDLVHGELRPLPCAACPRGTFTLWFCGASHGLCRACRAECPVCGKHLCPICDRDHASRHPGCVP